MTLKQRVQLTTIGWVILVVCAQVATISTLKAPKGIEYKNVEASTRASMEWSSQVMTVIWIQGLLIIIGTTMIGSVARNLSDSGSETPSKLFRNPFDIYDPD